MTRVISPPAHEWRHCALALVSLLLIMSANRAAALQAPQDRSEQSPAPQPAAEPALAGAQEAIDRGDYDTAARLLEEFLFQHPGHPAALFNLAYCYTLQGRFPEAVETYRQTLEVDPELVAAHFNLGLLLLDQGHLEEAGAELARTLELDPNHARAHLRRAEVLVKLGRHDDAIRHYRRALELDPDDLQARHSLLLVLYEKGALPDAERELRGLMKQDDDPSLILLLANLALKQDKPDDAIAAYEDYLRRGEPEAESGAVVHLHLGRLYRDQRKLEDALGHFRRAGELGNNDYALVSAWEQARTLSALKRYAESIPLYRKTLTLMADDVDTSVYADLGYALLEEHQYSEAVPLLTRVLQADPDRVEAYNQLASALYLSGNLPGALEVLDRRAARAPETPATLFLRAISYDKLGRCGPALAYYEKFLQQNPDSNSDPYFQATGRIRALRKTCRERLPAIE